MLAMMTMMMIMIKQKFKRNTSTCERPEVRCSLVYLHHLHKIFFTLLSKPSWTLFIRNPAIRFNGLLEIIESNHFCGGSGEGWCCTAAEMDIRHDEETDVFQGAWWQAISTPGSTSAIDVCRLQIWQDIIRTAASTWKRNNFWNYKVKCNSWKDLLSQGIGSRESHRRRSRCGREAG